MFLTSSLQPVHSWHFVEKVSLYLMIVLAVAMLFLPLLQPKQVEAWEPATTTVVVAGLFTLGGVILGVVGTYVLGKKKCPACKKEASSVDSHRYTDPKGHSYYNCQWQNNWQHAACHNSSSSSS